MSVTWFAIVTRYYVTNFQIVSWYSPMPTPWKNNLYPLFNIWEAIHQIFNYSSQHQKEDMFSFSISGSFLCKSVLFYFHVKNIFLVVNKKNFFSIEQTKIFNLKYFERIVFQFIYLFLDSINVLGKKIKWFFSQHVLKKLRM